MANTHLAVHEYIITEQTRTKCRNGNGGGGSVEAFNGRALRPWWHSRAESRFTVAQINHQEEAAACASGCSESKPNTETVELSEGSFRPPHPKPINRATDRRPSA